MIKPKFRFDPTFFMFGLAYLPGIAVVIHFACFTIRFSDKLGD